MLLGVTEMGLMKEVVAAKVVVISSITVYADV